MKLNPNRLWTVALALGWLLDFLFWKKAPGVNFAIFTTLCLIGGFHILLAEGRRPARTSLYLLPPIAFLAVVTFVRAEPMTIFLSYAVTLFLLIVLAVTYLGGRWIQYTMSDYVLRFFGLVGSMIARPTTFAADVRKTQAEAGISPSKRGALAPWPILRGIALALPVIALFAALLSSADLIFSQKLADFIELFNLEKLPEYIFRLVYILAAAYALAGVILHAASQSADDQWLGEDRPAVSPFLGFTESAIVLGGVVILFGAFVAVQFGYFFGGQANIHIDGYTYSEYARRGFGELVAVAFFSLLMLFGLSAVTRRETATQRRAFSGLGVSLVALLLIMLLSAYQRLMLYEAAYGFSRLRTYTHVFLIWIGLLLVAAIALEILHKERLFALAALTAAFGFVISLPILNVDAFIVRHNIARELAGSAGSETDGGRAALDAHYFLDLSDDAVPALVEAYQSPALPGSVKEQVGAALACIRHIRAPSATGVPWQSFRLSRLYADQALASIEAGLDEYEVSAAEGAASVVLAGGESFGCWAYMFD